MAYEAYIETPKVIRLFLEPRVEGVYVNAFSLDGSCMGDWLQNDLDMAMRQCERDYGVRRDCWVKVPNEPIHSDNALDEEPIHSLKYDESGMPIVNPPE